MSLLAPTQKVYEFAREAVAPLCDYPTEYDSMPSVFRNMNAIPKQVERIHALLPELGTPALNKEVMDKFERKEIFYPKPAERAIILPQWQAFAPTYIHAVLKVLAILEKKMKGNFVNQLGPVFKARQLKEGTRKSGTLNRIREEQEGELLFLGAQFGKVYAGMSPRHASERFSFREFPLGVFEVAMLLLLFPDRLTSEMHLGCICAGDQIPMSGMEKNYAVRPYFVFKDGKLELNEMWMGHMDPKLGVVTAFTVG